MTLQHSFRPLLAVLIAFAMLAGCGSGEPPRPRFYRMQPDETHLVVRWPEAASGEIPAISFRIPREAIDTGRIRLRDDGRTIGSVWINLMIDQHPKLKAAYDERNRQHASNPRDGTLEERWRPRTGFILDLGSYNDAYARESRRPKSDDYTLEVPYLGMARFSKLLCPDPSSTYARSRDWQRILARKESSDDPSPDGCAYWRTGSYITNSWPQDQGEEAVDIKCTPSTCDVYLQVRGRRVSVNLLHGDLALVPEIASAAHEIVRSYIINEEKNK